MRATLTIAALLAATVAQAASDVLVVRERSAIEHWSVEAGKWTKVGDFINTRKEKLSPIGITAADGKIYVANVTAANDGSIEELSAEGKRLRTVVAAVGSKPDQLCVSPDLKWIFATSIDGRVFKFDRASGSGGEILRDFSRSRMIKFGPDGYLYFTSMRSESIEIYDVSGKAPVKKGALLTLSQMGAFAFAGKYLTKLVIPAPECESIDLVSGTTAPFSKECTFQNCFSTVRVDGEIYAGDFVAGTISHVPSKPGAIEVVAKGVGNVSSMVNLSTALDGSETREFAEMWARIKSVGKGFAYASPKMPKHLDLQMIMYNNPGLTTYLSAGIWPGMRICKNGVVIHTGSVPRKIVRYYERTGLIDFKAGVETTWPKAPRPKKECNVPYGFPAGGGAHFRKAHSHSRRFADMDGDGIQDCMDFYSDWSEYGVPGPKCPVAYDQNEKWTNNQIQVFTYWYKRLGPKSSDKWSEPKPILCDGKKDLQGPFAIGGVVFDDYNHDGKLDMIMGDFRSDIWYLENVGTKEEPAFAKGRRIVDAAGNVVDGDLCMMDIQGDDWDGDGLQDIVATEEDGRASWFRYTGKLKDGVPVFEKQVFFRQAADELKFGCLSTPWCIDWDGDGDWDILAGNSAGYLAFIENLSGKGVEYPKWAEPKIFTVKDPQNCKVGKWLKGNIIQARCGDENSPQGPAEAKWGYSVLSAADWDGDGYTDLIANDVKGSVVWFRNPGKVGAMVMEAPRAIEVEWEGEQPRFSWEWRRPTGKVLRAQWRTTPLAYDWTGDGLVDLIMLDHEGVLSLYERAKQNGKLILKHPRRVFLEADGKPLALAGVKGGCGRRKFSLGDWDGDGKIDIIMNNVNAFIFYNLGTDENGVTRFRRGRRLARKALAGHTCCPSACDFNGDGIVDIVLGAEDGHFYYLRNPRSNEKAK